MPQTKRKNSSLFPDTGKNISKSDIQLQHNRPLIEDLRKKPMQELITDGIKVRNKLKLYSDTMNKKHSIIKQPIQSLEANISLYHPEFPINRDKPITTYSSFKPNAYQTQPFNKQHFKGWSENTHIPLVVEPISLHISDTTDHSIINIMQIFTDELKNPYTNISISQLPDNISRLPGLVDQNVPDFLTPITHNNKDDDVLLYDLQTSLKSISKDTIDRVNKILKEVQTNPEGSLNKLLEQITTKNGSEKIMDIIKRKNEESELTKTTWQWSDILTSKNTAKALITLKTLFNIANNNYSITQLVSTATYLLDGSYVYWPSVFAPEATILDANIRSNVANLGNYANTFEEYQYFRDNIYNPIAAHMNPNRVYIPEREWPQRDEPQVPGPQLALPGQIQPRPPIGRAALGQIAAGVTGAVLGGLSGGLGGAVVGGLVGGLGLS